MLTQYILALALGIGSVSAAGYDMIYVTGHDLDFSVSYDSGLQFSTSERPSEVLSASDLAITVPTVTLADPDGTGRDDRYVSFLEISYVPYFESLGNAIYTFPWIKTNQTVTENGTLSDEPSEARTIYHTDPIETSEIRNATVHVWKQTEELTAFLTEDEMPIFFQLALAWSNTTDDISYDFQRANIDFKVHNETGEFRGEVDQNGASISGYVSSTSAPSPTGTSDTPSSPTNNDAQPTSDAPAPSETPSAAAKSIISASALAWMLSALLLVAALPTV